MDEQYGTQDYEDYDADVDLGLDSQALPRFQLLPCQVLRPASGAPRLGAPFPGPSAHERPIPQARTAHMPLAEQPAQAPQQVASHAAGQGAAAGPSSDSDEILDSDADDDAANDLPRFSLLGVIQRQPTTAQRTPAGPHHTPVLPLRSAPQGATQSALRPPSGDRYRGGVISITQGNSGGKQNMPQGDTWGGGPIQTYAGYSGATQTIPQGEQGGPLRGMVQAEQLGYGGSMGGPTYTAAQPWQQAVPAASPATGPPAAPVSRLLQAARPAAAGQAAPAGATASWQAEPPASFAPPTVAARGPTQYQQTHVQQQQPYSHPYQRPHHDQQPQYPYQQHHNHQQQPQQQQQQQGRQQVQPDVAAGSRGGQASIRPCTNVRTGGVAGQGLGGNIGGSNTQKGWSVSVVGGKPTINLISDSDSEPDTQCRQQDQANGNTAGQGGRLQEPEAKAWSPPRQPWRLPARPQPQQPEQWALPAAAPPQQHNQHQYGSKEYGTAGFYGAGGDRYGSDYARQGQRQGQQQQQQQQAGYDTYPQGPSHSAAHNKDVGPGQGQQRGAYVGGYGGGGGVGGGLGDGGGDVPWWQLLDDFVPVHLLKDAIDPRDGARVHVLYQQQFTEGAAAAHTALHKRHAGGATGEEDALLKAGGFKGRGGGGTKRGSDAPGTGSAKRRRASSAADVTPGVGMGGDGDMSMGAQQGRWFTDADGRKVYIDAAGQTHTGTAAFRRYKKDKSGASPGGRKRGRGGGGFGRKRFYKAKSAGAGGGAGGGGAKAGRGRGRKAK